MYSKATMFKSYNETTPLLLSSNPTIIPGLREENKTSYSGSSVKLQPCSLGPLEITPSTRRRILAGVWLGMFLSSVNGALIATLLSSISSEFQATNQASWLGTSYLLANCTFTPLYGRLCDILGRRRANQFAILLAALGALFSAMSGSMLMLIAAQFVSGVGGGGACITAMIISNDMYILRHRSWIQGVAGVFIAAGQGIGSPLGGYINEQFGWRWAFIIQMPLYVISLLLIEYNLHYVMPGKSKSTKEVLKKIDYGGTISLMLSIAFFLGFLNFKYSEQLPLKAPRVYITLLLTVMMFIIFVIFELCIAPQPILSPSLLRQKVPVLVGLGNMLVAINEFASLYFFPVYFERVMLTSASTAGMHLIPKSIAMTLGCLFAGAMICKSGSYKKLGVVAAGGSVIGTFFLATLNENSHFLTQWFGIVPMGLGNAVVIQTTMIALLASVEPVNIAVATGFAQLWRCVGQIAGVAVPSAIFQHLVNRELTARITGPEAQEIIAAVRGSAKYVHSLPFELQQHAKESYGIALKQIFWYLLLSSLVAFLIQLVIPSRSLIDQKVETAKIQSEESCTNNTNKQAEKTV